MISEFETRIAGIPALVRIVGYTAPSPGSFFEPPTFEDVELEVCDQRGRWAPWLERKLDEHGREHLRREAFAHLDHIEELQHDY